jgi:hypothetical protein
MIAQSLLSFFSLLTYTVNSSIVMFSSYLIVEPFPSFFSFVDWHCKTLLSLFSLHIWLSYHFCRFFLLAIDIVNTYIVIFSSHLIDEPLLSFFPFVYLHCKTLLSLFSLHIWLLNHFYRASLLLFYTVIHFYPYFLIIFQCPTTSSFLSFVDLHCKALLSLFSHYIWLSNHFYRSSIMLTSF